MICLKKPSHATVPLSAAIRCTRKNMYTLRNSLGFSFILFRPSLVKSSDRLASSSFSSSTLNQDCGFAFIWSGSNILGWIPIRIQSRSRVLIKNVKNFRQKEKTIWIKNYNLQYLSLGLHKERPSYRRSLQLSKENIQPFKTWNLKKIFFVGHFCPPGSGSGFRKSLPWTRPNAPGICFRTLPSAPLTTGSIPRGPTASAGSVSHPSGWTDAGPKRTCTHCCTGEPCSAWDTLIHPGDSARPYEASPAMPETSVPDPDPYPPDPRGFGPPGSGSFYH